MKLKIRHLISSPFIATAAYLFFVYVPYLYPTFHFPFEKVYGFWEHTLVCLVLFTLILVARVLAHYPHLKLPKFESSKIVVPKVSKAWFYIATLFLLASLFMNVLMDINAMSSYTGNLSSSKKSLEDFGGINIISQLCLFFVVPYLIYIEQNKRRWGYLFLGLLLLSVMVRSYFMAERLAALELLIPIVITFVTIKGTKVLLTKLLKYFFILLGFFVLFELTRQFRNQYKDEAVDLGFKVSWTVERFFDYYGDTQNKFYYALENDMSFTSTSYLDWGGRILKRVGLDVTKQTDKIDYGEYVWKDFTNKGGLAMIYTDFGLLMGIGFFVCYFTSFFVLWFKLKKGSLYAWSIYPFFFVWIIELARYNPIFLTRFLVPFMVFNAMYLFYEGAKNIKVQ